MSDEAAQGSPEQDEFIKKLVTDWRVARGTLEVLWAKKLEPTTGADESPRKTNRSSK